MRIEKIKRIVLIVMLLTCTISHSVPIQGENPGEPPGCDSPPCDDQAPEHPIDGGLSLLLIAGTAFGAYELRKKKKKCTS